MSPRSHFPPLLQLVEMPYGKPHSPVKHIGSTMGTRSLRGGHPAVKPTLDGFTQTPPQNFLLTEYYNLFSPLDDPSKVIFCRDTKFETMHSPNSSGVKFLREVMVNGKWEPILASTSNYYSLVSEEFASVGMGTIGGQLQDLAPVLDFLLEFDKSKKSHKPTVAVPDRPDFAHRYPNSFLVETAGSACYVYYSASNRGILERVYIPPAPGEAAEVDLNDSFFSDVEYRASIAPKLLAWAAKLSLLAEKTNITHPRRR